MLREFIAWLDGYLAKEGPSALAKSVVGLLSFAALLGVIIGSPAVRAGAIVAVILVTVSLGLMLLADRRSLRRRVELGEQVITRYADFIRAAEPGYRMTSWAKTIIISQNGDAVENLTVHARVEKPDIRLVWLYFGCGWPQPAKYRNRVELRVRNLLDGDLPGTSLDTTMCWLADGRFVVVAHLSRPPKVGDEIRYRMDVVWPGKCAPLVRGRGEDFAIRLENVIARARYRIVLPRGCETYCETIGFQKGDEGLELGLATTDDNCPVYQLDARNLPGGRRVGLRLELKGESFVAAR